MLGLSGFFLYIIATITQKFELIQCDTCHFQKYFIRNDGIKSCQRYRIISICHKEWRDCPRKTTQMISDTILDCFLFTLLFLGFYGLDCLFCRFFCKIRNSSCQFLIEFLHSHFLLLLKFFINLLWGFTGFISCLLFSNTLIFYNISLNLIIGMQLINHPIGFMIQFWFNLSFICCFHIRAICWLRSIHNCLDCTLLYRLFQFVNRFLCFVRSLFHLRHCFLYLRNHIIDFISKNILSSSNHKFITKSHFPIFIQR